MSKTLLLADDSVTIQKVVGISFASEDVTLLTVDNGDDAVAKAREARPDLILADVVMPGKNGYEVCEAIKSDPELRHIPVVLLTGTFEAFDEERARQAGAAAHVAKPFEAQTLVDQVNRLLAESQPAPPVSQPAPAPPVQATTTPQIETVSAPPRAAAAPTAPAAPPAAAAASAMGSPEDSFDFFDDELGDLKPDEDAPSLEVPSGSDLELDARDAAFAFGDDDLSPPAAGRDALAGSPPIEDPLSLDSSPAGGMSAGDRTVAILPDAPDEVPSAELAPPLSPAETMIGDLEPLEPEPTAAAVPGPDDALASDPLAAVEPSGAEEPLGAGSSGFDFEFEGEAAAAHGESLVEPGDLAREAVVDPAGVSSFDISSSDLGAALASGPADLVAPSAAPPPARDVPRALADTAPRVEEPVVHLEPESPSDAQPVAEAEPLAEAEPPSRDPVADAEGAMAAVPPELRAQLHDTLEKIAWESFSEVTEKIVRQAVERVERIAWEVIPHMAETLVREEIRRMKGEK